MLLTYKGRDVGQLSYHFDRFDISISLPVIALIATLLYAIYVLLTLTDKPKIRGIYEIPNALPIVGHLLQLGDDHATVCEKWWREYKRDVFQIRLGNTRKHALSFSLPRKRRTLSNDI